MDKNILIARYPRLYHMAEGGSWNSIMAHGLLSTKAILDYFEINGDDRRNLESQHRPISVRLGHGQDFVLRDQKPMSPARLQTALPSHIQPADWYAFINSRVFFWTLEERLLGLLSAREYRGVKHDVLTIETESLVDQYRGQILLCHMNSGNTFPFAHKRDFDIFQNIDEYPAKPKGGPAKEVVELTVDYAVPDISRHVISVTEMQGSQAVRVKYQR